MNSPLFSKGNHVVLGTQAVIIIIIITIFNTIMRYAYLVTDNHNKSDLLMCLVTKTHIIDNIQAKRNVCWNLQNLQKWV